MKNFDQMPSAEANSSEWETLKIAAPTLAKSIMNELGVEHMATLDEQINALKQWLDTNDSNQETRAAFRIIDLEMEKLVLRRNTETKMKIYDAALAQYEMV